MTKETPVTKKNVLGQALQICCQDPVTGYFRDGYCRTDITDHGRHIICAEMTKDFLEFSRAKGNDLSTPRPEYDFPGLNPGDRWCVCVLRWKEALEAGVAPPVFLESCEESALQFVSFDALQAHSTHTLH